MVYTYLHQKNHKGDKKPAREKYFTHVLEQKLIMFLKQLSFRNIT